MKLQMFNVEMSITTNNWRSAFMNGNIPMKKWFPTNLGFVRINGS